MTELSTNSGLKVIWKKNYLKFQRPRKAKILQTDEQDKRKCNRESELQKKVYCV